ncbi:MAG: DUF177 domain-containing protein [Lachnospiraceae bacterium]|nr:DUF177 domain-containing protein [Lachnospiraceae bacterium]
MLVNLSEAMNRKDEEQHKEVALEFSEFEMLGVTYPVITKSNVSLVLVSHAPKKVKVTANAKLSLQAPCDRCLEAVELPFDIDFEEEFDFSKSEQERAEELDETCYITGFDLDVDKLIREELLLSFPMKVLCRDDCKGICKVCGNNLNTGECGCDRTELDPRMAAIRDIFKNVKEV